MNAWHRRTNGVGMWVAAAGLVVGLGGQSALAQNQGDQGAPKPMQTLVAFERAPLGDFLTDPKDAALKNALSMLPARLMELPQEIPDLDQDSAKLITSIARTISRRGRVAITYTPNFSQGGAMGYGLILSTPFENKADADSFEQSVLGAIKRAAPDFPGEESKRFPSLTQVVIPVAPLHFGSREVAGGKGGGGASYDIIWGAVTNPDAPFEKLPAASLKGTPLVRGTFDLQGLGAIVNFAQTGINAAMQKSDQVPVQLGRELAAWGIIGQNAIKGQFEVVATDNAMRSRTVIQNLQKLQEQMGTEKGSLSTKDLAAIPADATTASMSLVTMKPLLKLVGALKERFPQAAEGLAQFHEQTGVDLEQDLIATLGGTMAFYTSESTGGGGLGSGIAMVTFVDRAKFLASHNKLRQFAVQMMENQPEAAQVAKYVRLRTWKEGAADVMSIVAAGVPVPLELTYAATDRWFVFGFTPQSVTAAVRQIQGQGDAGVMSRADVAAEIPKGKELTSFSMTDVPHSMHEGYTFTCLIGSAVSNAMRSPHDAAREPGVLVPSFKDLKKGARITVGYSYREGENVVVEGISDRSLLVGMAGTLNLGSMIGSMAPAMMGAAQQARLRGGMVQLDAAEGATLALRAAASGPSALASPASVVLWSAALANQLEIAR